LQTIYAPPWDAYELIDAGKGQKLERWGSLVTIRPDSMAYFQPKYDMDNWLQQADFVFHPSQGVFGEWKALTQKPFRWTISFEGVNFMLALKDTKHTGIFPEQAINWGFIKEKLGPGSKFLNLFGYTGASSLVGMLQGAEVIHVDSSKSVLGWANENRTNNAAGIMKLVHEDALLFIQRERKRGAQYDVLQMDPPAWGNGKQGKKWKLEDCIEGLLSAASGILKEDGVLLLNTYSSALRYDSIINLLSHQFPNKKIQSGALKSKAKSGKVLEHGYLFKVY